MTARLLHNIGTIKDQNYNTREEILACNDFLTFDGIYLNVYENQDVLEGKRGIFFIMGAYLGKDNTFDLAYVPKLEKYCDLRQVIEMSQKYNFDIGWHTHSHPDLTKLSKKEIMEEVKCPIEGINIFAYPYGKYNDLVVECIKECRYKQAYSVGESDGTKFTIKREYLNK